MYRYIEGIAILKKPYPDNTNIDNHTRTPVLNRYGEDKELVRNKLRKNRERTLRIPRKSPRTGESKTSNTYNNGQGNKDHCNNKL